MKQPKLKIGDKVKIIQKGIIINFYKDYIKGRTLYEWEELNGINPYKHVLGMESTDILDKIEWEIIEDHHKLKQYENKELIK